MNKETLDAVGIFLLPGQVGQFYRELQVQHLSLPTFGSDVFDSLTEVKAAQGGMEGAFLAHHVVSDSFRTSYIKRFGNDYQIAAAGQGYDLANLLGALFGNEDKSLNSKQILARLRTSGIREGVTGQFRFIATKEKDEFFSFPVKLKRIENNKIVTVDTTTKE
jgi:ABC-type branched-subunit amino acid transport system substrate-binding protein